MKIEDPPAPPAPTNRIVALDALRGISCVAVLLFHANVDDHHAILSQLFSGLYIFFVITGFIIPYSLAKAAPTLGNVGRYYLKRALRLEPPYIVSLVLILVLNEMTYALPTFQGTPYRPLPSDLALHLAYLVPYFDREWLQVVYWTLLVEFQFYLCFTPFFLLAVKPHLRRSWVWPGACIALWSLSFLPGHAISFPPFAGYFALGFALCGHKLGKLSNRTFYALSTVIAASLVLQHPGNGIAAIVAWLGIHFDLPRNQRWLEKIGIISFSLYLLHVPISGKVFNLLTRFVEKSTIASVWPLISLAVSLAAAVVYYRFVELPSQHWSKKIRLTRPSTPESPTKD